MQAAIMYGPNDIRVEDIEKPKCPPNGLNFKSFIDRFMWFRY